jgi:hypothetical protein
MGSEQSLKIYRVFKKERCNDIPNVIVCRVLRKRLHLKVYSLYALTLNVFVTLATQ